MSVVVPAWNAEATIEETLLSVARQTCEQIEILIVDDGSTDRTAELAARFCATEPRARLISKQNGGVASARNAGIRAARAEWIAPIDSDDLWHPEKLEKQLAEAGRHSGTVGFVYCRSFLIDGESRVVGCTPHWQAEGMALQQLAYLNFVANGSALLLARAALASVGGFDESLREAGAEGSEDLLLQLRIAQRFPICGLREHLVGYRVRPGAMSSDAQRMARSWRFVFQRLQEEGAPIPKQVIRWTKAARLLRLAEAEANRRQVGWTFLHLGQAVGGDPVRTALYLAYRVLRLAARLANGRRSSSVAVSYRDMPTDACVANDPDGLPWLANRIQRIDRRRLHRLARREGAGLSCT